MWTSLATLVVAVAAAAAAIEVAQHRHGSHPSYATVASSVAVGEPGPAGATTTGTPNVDTSKLPTAPEPGARTPPGRTVWPTTRNGWTIVLVSYPKTFGHAEALGTAKKAAKAGLNEVGVIDSSGYASLQPGYFVVFTGIYGSKADADAAVATARQAGFPGAYSRQIAR